MNLSLRLYYQNITKMTDNAVVQPKKLSKKEVRVMVYEKISGALAEFKPDMKEKRFTNNLKKASKLFAADIARTISKKQKLEKPSKKKKLAKQIEMPATPE